MENISCFNFSNHTLVSNISLSDIFEGAVGIGIECICCVYVIYIVYHIIKYLTEKAPNLQTMLDGFYIQYFAALIAMVMSCNLMNFLIQMNVVLNLENETLTWIASYIFYSTFLFCSLSLATSCVARTFSIFWPSKIETTDDKTCWLLNG